MERRVKPGQLQFALAHREWIRSMALRNSVLDIARETKPRIVYFGDDPLKDWMMARDAGILFGFFGKGEYSVDTPNCFSFGNWEDVSGKISGGQELLRKGLPLEQVLTPGISRLEMGAYRSSFKER